MLEDALAHSMKQLQQFYSILCILMLFLNVLSDLFKYSITLEIRASLVLHTKVYRIVYLCTHITYIISFLFSWHFLIFWLFSLSFLLGKLFSEYNLMYTVFLCVAVSIALLHILMLRNLIHSLECCLWPRIIGFCRISQNKHTAELSTWVIIYNLLCKACSIINKL